MRDRAEAVLKAFATVAQALEPLDAVERERVLDAVRALLAIPPSSKRRNPVGGGDA